MADTIVFILLILAAGLFVLMIIWALKDAIGGYIDKINYAYREVINTEKYKNKEESYILSSIKMPNVKPPKPDDGSEIGTVVIILKNSSNLMTLKNEPKRTFNQITKLMGNSYDIEIITNKEYTVRLEDITAVTFDGRVEKVDNPPNGGSSKTWWDNEKSET